MFNRKFKLIGTAVGLVTMVVGLMLPGIGQTGPGECPPGPVPCIDRAKLVQGLQNAFAGLMASAEDLLDLEQAAFWSDGIPRQMVYIPPHAASVFLPRLKQLLAGEKVEGPLGGIWVTEDGTGRLPPGAYRIRLKSDGKKVAFINSQGEEVLMVPARIHRIGWLQIPDKVDRITFELTIITNVCWRARLGPIEFEYHSQ